MLSFQQSTSVRQYSDGAAMAALRATQGWLIGLTTVTVGENCPVVVYIILGRWALC